VVVVLVVTVLYMEMVGVVGKYVINALALEERGFFCDIPLKISLLCMQVCRCLSCNGTGIVSCPTCAGKGALKCFILLVVTWLV